MMNRLEAVRTIIDALAPFKPEEQSRVLQVAQSIVELAEPSTDVPAKVPRKVRRKPGGSVKGTRPGISVKQAAEMCKVPEQAIYDARHREVIKGWKEAAGLRLSYTSVKAYAARLAARRQPKLKAVG